jgi:hypothetical protein
LPADLEAIVLRCLAKSPADRCATAAELERDLAACAVANDWSAARAQTWWQQRGDASTPAREDDAWGRTVEIDPGARQAVEKRRHPCRIARHEATAPAQVTFGAPEARKSTVIRIY